MKSELKGGDLFRRGGDAAAQNKLSVLYRDVSSVAKDLNTALAWFQKSAKQCFTKAMIKDDKDEEKMTKNPCLLVSRALTLVACLALLAAPSFADSWSKVIGLSNEMESWLSSNGSANDCLSLDKEVTLYGGFVNSCPFKVQYVFCAYRPNKGSWTESFDCEKGKGGYDIIGAKGRQAAHTRNAESTHWAACPWSDMDGKFLDISIDAKWDGQRKLYEARCVLKNNDKKDKADKKIEPKDEEPVALVRRGGSTGTDMFKQAITKAEQAEREEKERIARLERERIERERLEKETRERDLARRNVDDNRKQPEQQSVAGSKSCRQIAGEFNDRIDYLIYEKIKNNPIGPGLQFGQSVWKNSFVLHVVNTHPACINDINYQSFMKQIMSASQKQCREAVPSYVRTGNTPPSNCEVGTDVLGLSAIAGSLLNKSINDYGERAGKQQQAKQQATPSKTCNPEGFDQAIGEFSNRYPVNSGWGMRDTYQYAYFFGIEGLKILQQYKPCMPQAQYDSNYQALAGSRDSGLKGCRQVSVDGGNNCIPQYP